MDFRNQILSSKVYSYHKIYTDYAYLLINWVIEIKSYTMLDEFVCDF